MNSETIQKALNWRYATKKMDPAKKISDQDWQTLKDALRFAPSSYGLQPWKFIVVQNKGLRAQLRKVSWDQSQVEDASHYVVFAVKKEMDEAHINAFVNQMAKVRQVAAESVEGYRQFMVQNIVHQKPIDTHLSWNQRQAYIAMGFLLETASLLNIDSVPLEGLDPVAYDEILDLKNSGYGVVAAVALGYRSSEDSYQHMTKVRFDESVIFDIRN